MITLTAKEAQVVKAIRDICYDEVDATAKDIAEHTGMAINSVKGVLGSLQQKDTGLVALGQGEVPNVHNAPMYDCVNYVSKAGEVVSFGCDNLEDEDAHTDEEIDAMVGNAPAAAEEKPAPVAAKKEEKEDKGPSKMEQARTEYKALVDSDPVAPHKRADFIKVFVEKVGLTPKGAATYYQKIKKEMGA